MTEDDLSDVQYNSMTNIEKYLYNFVGINPYEDHRVNFFCSIHGELYKGKGNCTKCKIDGHNK